MQRRGSHEIDWTLRGEGFSEILTVRNFFVLGDQLLPNDELTGYYSVSSLPKPKSSYRGMGFRDVCGRSPVKLSNRYAAPRSLLRRTPIRTQFPGTAGASNESKPAFPKQPWDVGTLGANPKADMEIDGHTL